MSKRCAPLTALLLTLGLLTLSACSANQPRATAQAPAAQEKPAAGEATWAPLDKRLTQYSYPYEVKVFPVQVQGQDLEMAYMDIAPTGTPSGQVVLLLHGKNFSGAYWAKTIEVLTEAGHRVVVPDQLGFGKSSKPVNIQYSFQLMATQTRALLDKLGVKEAHVVGHSMGGMVATRFALMYPEVAKRLVLVNPIGLEDWKRKVPYQTVDKWTASVKKNTPEGIQNYMKQNYFDGQWKEDWNSLVTIQAGWAVGPDKDQMARVSALTYDMVFTQPVVYEFPDLKMPTLLLIGTRDRTALGKPLVSPEVRATMGLYEDLGKAAAAAIPNASLVEFEDVGHMPQVEVFGPYSQALLDFVKP
jgi:pimeloyl-ACP methyl ester carboxylesterase